MAQITASLVKELREKTSAGMMDCKKALSENDGDLEAAVDWLRTKGLAAAAKKSGRIAAEGLVGMATGGESGALVEVNSETDFVALNEDFQAFVKTVSQLALANEGNQAAVIASGYPETERTVEEQLAHNISTIGENMNIRRMNSISVKQGVVASYVHNAVTAGLGKIGVVVALESSGDTGALEALGKQLAMHIAATNPQSVNVSDLDPELVEREKQVQADKARDSGKPEAIIEKMMEGRMRKYYEEVVLLNQTFVIDGDRKVADVIAESAKDLGADIVITEFVRYALGEGIEKKESDFAAEVMEAAGV